MIQHNRLKTVSGEKLKRKVIKHGPSTYIISLPIEWVKKHSITKGMELEVAEEGKKIVVSSENEDKPLEITADITGLDRTSIMYIIRSFYRLGYDTVKINFNKPTTIYQRTDKTMNTLSVIHTEVNRLIGYEIVQEGEKTCTIKDLQNASEKDFDTILRRIFLLIVYTSRDLLEGIKNNDISLLETIENKHDTITKFVSYCLRLLNKKTFIVQRKTSYYYHIIALLDRITDVIKYAAREIIEYNKKLSPQIIQIIEIIVKDIYNYYQLFYNYNNTKITEINTNRYKAEKDLKKIPNTTKTQEIIIANSIFQILETLLDLIESRTALEY